MHIGLIIYGSIDTVSGGYLYDRQLVAALERAGHTVDIVSLPNRGYFHHLIDNVSPGFRRQLRQKPVDLWLQDELNHPSLFWLNRWLRRHSRVPIVSIVHHLRVSEAHPASLQSLYHPIEKAYLNGCDGFLFNSHTTKRSVERLVGKATADSHIALPAGDRFAGVDVKQITSRIQSRHKAPLKIIFVGNLTPRKGVETLIEAIGHLPPNRFTATLIGNLSSDQAYASQIEQQIERLGDPYRISMTGRLPDHELEAAFHAADLLVVPSQYEGFGIVYLEGMGFGLPAIGTTAGGAGELIEEGHNGYLIRPGDAKALAAHLARLESDRDHLLSMSLVARARFEAHPSWENSMAGAVPFLQSLVTAGRGHK